MKKSKATELQNRVFRTVFSRDTRIRKRRAFLVEALKNLHNVCNYSPEQIKEICHRIAVDISFNPFFGVSIHNFQEYCVGYTNRYDQEIDKINIILLPVSLGVLDFFKREEKYKVNYYFEGKLIYSSTLYARRF